MTNPVGGREDAFNDWYDNKHNVDLLKVPEVMSSQRFRLAEDQRTVRPHPYRYMAKYDVETDDLPAFIATMTPAAIPANFR